MPEYTQFYPVKYDEATGVIELQDGEEFSIEELYDLNFAGTITPVQDLSGWNDWLALVTIDNPEQPDAHRWYVAR